MINIEKSEAVLGDISVVYSDCFDITKDAERILKRANGYGWKQAAFENIVKAFGDFMAKLWKVHPFREGNTRTVVTFCSMFIEAQGFYIESDLFKDNAAYMRNALVAANAIFDDLGDLRKPEYLYRIDQDALEQGRELSCRGRIRAEVTMLSVRLIHWRKQKSGNGWICIWNRFPNTVIWQKKYLQKNN